MTKQYNQTLEKFYEIAILTQYDSVIGFEKITWKDHVKVGLDTWAHYFDDERGREYVLLYEDFPGGEYLNDDLSHETVKLKGQNSLYLSLEPGRQIDNLLGYFTLYQEKQ